MPDTLLTEEKLFRIRLVTDIIKNGKNVFVQFSFKSFIVTSRTLRHIKEKQLLQGSTELIKQYQPFIYADA